MSQDAVENLLGRIITDKGFRQRAMVSLEQACAGVGLLISAEEMIFLKAIDFKLFDQVAESIDGAIRRS